MKLQRIHIAQFRQFRHPLELDNLLPGINLFHGPNESGKSTVAQAIRAAFLERYGSGTLGHFQPWGDSAAAPEVSLDFDWNGVPYRLIKRFLRQKRCYLEVGSRSFDGDEAEQQLAQLLGFNIPARGASKPEHWGIPGLLWIEQGAGQEFRDATGHASEHLQAALDQSTGQLASTDGDVVVRKVQERMARLMTPATQAPAREYAAAQKDEAALQAELAALDQTIVTYRQQVDQLALLQAQHQKDSAALPWLALRQQEQDATRQLAQADQLSQEQKRQQDALASCLATQKLLHDQLQTYEARRAQLRQREEALVQVHEEQDAVQLRTASLEATLKQAGAEWEAANADLQRVRNAQVLQAKVDALKRETSSLDDLQQQLSKANAVHDELQRLQQALRQHPMDLQQLKRLQALHHQRDTLSARQESVATRLQFELDDGQSIVLDNQPLHGQGERRLVQESELRLPGIGRLRIVPGGQDLNELRREYSRVQDEYDAIQAQLGVADLATAQARAEENSRLQAAITQNTALLEVHAPQALQALIDRVQHQELAVERLRQDLPVIESEDDVEPLALAEAQATADAAERSLKASERVWHEHMATLASVATSVQTARREHQQAQASVTHMNEHHQEKDVLRDLNQQRAIEQDLRGRIEDYQKHIDSVRPDILRQDIQRYAASAQQLEQAHVQRERDIFTLQVELQAAGAQGTEEQRSILAGKLGLVQRRLAEFTRNAHALKLLHGLLQNKRQELTQRLQAPLQKHLDHYLQLLFPQGKLTVDERLVPDQLRRPDVGAGGQAAVDELSFGAREQLGLISRLAYADLLRAAGKPTLIMLDDALVHSDAQRLNQMKRVLFDAAQRHQILLFTCHPDNWRDLGVAPRAIRS